MNRKKKIRFYQLIFLLAGGIIILFTYVNDNTKQDGIISENLQKKINDKLKGNNNSENNKFYNVKYSGLDLEGNRYIILAEEAVNASSNINMVAMKDVKATFYFKDDTVLNISSREGDSNNKTLDIEFRKEIKAIYENSELYAEKAIFSNSNNSLVVSDKVKIVDSKGSMLADRLIFDIKDKTLNISSLKNSMIKSKINYK